MTIAKTAIAIFVAIMAVLGLYGLQYVWYRNTGYREQNQAGFKPQEIAYPASPEGLVSTAGKEPPVETRFQARLLKNPVPANADSLSTGEDLYMTYCEPCHGRTGDGKGIMGSVPTLSMGSEGRIKTIRQYLSGYMAEVPDFDLNFVQHETEGEVYRTISTGGEAIMPSFKDALNPEQRWNLVNYIKHKLGEESGR